MDFGLNEEQQMIVDTTRAFVETELYPHEQQVERTGVLPLELIREIRRAGGLGFEPRTPDQRRAIDVLPMAQALTQPHDLDARAALLKVEAPHAARGGHRVAHRDAKRKGILPRPPNIARDHDRLKFRELDRHTRVEQRCLATQALHECLPDLFDGLPRDLQIAHEWKRQRTARQHAELT